MRPSQSWRLGVYALETPVVLATVLRLRLGVLAMSISRVRCGRVLDARKLWPQLLKVFHRDHACSTTALWQRCGSALRSRTGAANTNLSSPEAAPEIRVASRDAGNADSATVSGATPPRLALRLQMVTRRCRRRGVWSMSTTEFRHGTGPAGNERGRDGAVDVEGVWPRRGCRTPGRPPKEHEGDWRAATLATVAWFDSGPRTRKRGDCGAPFRWIFRWKCCGQAARSCECGVAAGLWSATSRRIPAARSWRTAAGTSRRRIRGPRATDRHRAGPRLRAPSCATPLPRSR